MDRKIKTIKVPGFSDDAGASVYRSGPVSGRSDYIRRRSAYPGSVTNYVTEYQMSDPGKRGYKSGNGSNVYVADWQMLDRFDG